MKLNITFHEKVCTIAIEGSIDTLTSPELEQEITAVEQNCEKMILNMTGVDYISSAGLRVVVGANHSLGKGNLTLKGLRPNVFEIFRMTGFTKHINIES